MTYTFGHEQLDAYQAALAILRGLDKSRWPAAWLRNQGMRAMTSVVLNIAEGDGRTGRARINHFRIALGSLNEVAAMVDVAFRGNPKLKDDLGQVAKMLHGLIKKG